jgi:hypothetical protein
VVLKFKGAERVKVAVVPFDVTVPDIGVEPFISINSAVVIVVGSIGLLKITVMVVLIATLEAE